MQDIQYSSHIPHQQPFSWHVAFHLARKIYSTVPSPPSHPTPAQQPVSWHMAFHLVKNKLEESNPCLQFLKNVVFIIHFGWNIKFKIFPKKKFLFMKNSSMYFHCPTENKMCHPNFTWPHWHVPPRTWLRPLGQPLWTQTCRDPGWSRQVQGRTGAWLLE